jgi:hypothetical protein
LAFQVHGAYHRPYRALQRDRPSLLLQQRRWLLHVHLLLEVAVEEGQFDIHVVDAPALLGCQCEEDPE